MAATSASRAKFIASLKAFLSANNLDGVDIDWEYPCSAPRSNSVEISCTKFRDIEDKGGNCPGDSASLLALAKDMRAGLGDSAYISIASQAAKQHWEQMNLAAVTPYIDHWHVMTYDYTVSDIMGGATMSPNAPLYNPPAPATQMSISYSIEGYIAAGVPASKIMLGIPFYGMIPSHHPPLPPPLATHPNPTCTPPHPQPNPTPTPTQATRGTTRSSPPARLGRRSASTARCRVLAAVHSSKRTAPSLARAPTSVSSVR